MSTAAPLQNLAAKPKSFSNSTHAGLLLQRKCACGSPTSSLTGECAECKSKKRLQTKLAIGASNDPLEQEADRVADQVLAAPASPAVRSARPLIQRFTGQATGQTDAAPASVDRVLASPGRLLEPALRRDMEQRFGHDFANVRIHSGAAAEQSTRDVSAKAYTVGHNVVFGAGRFAPGTHAGRRLIAHELTHVIQQSGASEGTVRRQVDPQQTHGTGDPPSLFTIFVADPHRRADKWFARQQGRADAARIQAGGTLSLEDRQLVKAKLRFFEGDAKEAYSRQIKPALLLATQPEIEMEPVYLGKVPDAKPAEQARIRRRREHTLRYFAKLDDYKLEKAYVSRLQRYVDEGMEANAKWDVEMIEQIIEERAPNAPWYEAARQDFLEKRAAKLRTQEREKRLSKLSPYWQNQFGALAEQTGNWPEGARVYAQDLLWKWNEQVAKYDDNPYLRDVVQPAVAEEMILNDIVEQYELVLRDRDRAIQDECRRNPPGGWMKVYGDPCKPWFENSSQRGEQERRNLERRLRIFRDKDRVPCRDIVFWLEEYMKQVSALPTQMGEVHLQLLQTWSMVQGGFAMANKPMKNLPAPGVGRSTPSLGGRPTAPALPSRPQAQLPPGAARPKVGDIISPQAKVGLGPHVVIAVLPEGELLKPVLRMPPSNRALPPATPTTSSIVKSPRSTVPVPTVSAPRVPSPPPPLRPAAQLALKPAPPVVPEPTAPVQTQVPPGPTPPKQLSNLSTADVKRQLTISQRDVQNLPNTNPNKQAVLGELKKLLKETAELEKKQGQTDISKELANISRRDEQLDDLVADAVAEANMSRRPAVAPAPQKTAPPPPGKQPPQLEQGQQYNKAHAFDYKHRELYVRDPKGGPSLRLDGYEPGKWIVSRKNQQLSEIPLSEAKGHIAEFAKSYAKGRLIDQVKSSGVQTGGAPVTGGEKLSGTLQGEYVLEVPIQSKPVPVEILAAAKSARVIIRDVAGNTYALP